MGFFDEDEEESCSESVSDTPMDCGPKKIALVLRDNCDKETGASVVELESGGGSELGCKLWTAAVLLCEYLKSKPHIVRGLDVLEVGAGLGACGFTASALGARSTTIADCAPETMDRLSHTLASYEASLLRREDRALAGEEKKEAVFGDRSGTPPFWDSATPAVNVSLRRHLWEEDLEFVQAKEERREMDPVRHWSKRRDESELAPRLGFGEVFDVVLGSDLLYFSCQEAPLLAALKLRLGSSGSTAHILQTMRTNNVDVFWRFIESAQKEFQVDIVDDVRPDDFYGAAAVRANETNHTTGYKLVTITRR